MRRLVIEEPVSRAAIWGRRVALFSVPVFAAGIVLVRGGDVTAGFAVSAAGALVAAGALALGMAALARIWREGRRGLPAAVTALLIASVVLALPAFFVVRLLANPYYADLTTDTLHPPAFSRSSAAIDARAGTVPHAGAPEIAATVIPPVTPPIEDGAQWLKAQAEAAIGALTRNLVLPVSDPARLRDLQRRAHPDLRPLRTDLAPEAAFALTVKTAESEGWTIVDRTPPGGRFGLGHIDAVHRTGLLRLPVDVTVRLRIHAEGTTVDVRSIPRYRLFDIGTGPGTIERFLSAIDAD